MLPTPTQLLAQPLSFTSFPPLQAPSASLSLRSQSRSHVLTPLPPPPPTCSPLPPPTPARHLLPGVGAGQHAASRVLPGHPRRLLLPQKGGARWAGALGGTCSFEHSQPASQTLRAHTAALGGAVLSCLPLALPHRPLLPLAQTHHDVDAMLRAWQRSPHPPQVQAAPQGEAAPPLPREQQQPLPPPHMQQQQAPAGMAAGQGYYPPMHQGQPPLPGQAPPVHAYGGAPQQGQQPPYGGGFPPQQPQFGPGGYGQQQQWGPGGPGPQPGGQWGPPPGQMPGGFMQRPPMGGMPGRPPFPGQPTPGQWR